MGGSKSDFGCGQGSTRLQATVAAAVWRLRLLVKLCQEGFNKLAEVTMGVFFSQVCTRAEILYAGAKESRKRRFIRSLTEIPQVKDRLERP